MTKAERDQVLSKYAAHASRFDAIATSRARRHGVEPELDVLQDSPVRTVRPGLPDLTAREVDVLSLVADGFSNAEIGVKLFIAEDTVKSHIRRILEKMKARNRAHAVGLAFRRGFFGGTVTEYCAAVGVAA